MQSRTLNLTKKMGTEIQQDAVPYAVRSVVKQSTEYIVDIFGAIENLSDIQDAIFCMSLAEENDSIILNLNSPGGDLSVTDTLILAMNSCKCPVHIRGSGTIASAATLILLTADSFEISPFTTFLFHSATYSYGGKQQDMLEYIAFTEKQLRAMLTHYYQGFFNEQELEEIIVNKKEVWMNADEFLARFQAYIAHKEAEAALEAELEAEENELEND